LSTTAAVLRVVQDGREDGVERARGTDEQADGVDPDGQAVALADDVEGLAAEADDVRYLRQVVGRERDVGGLHGHLGAGQTHGDADVGERQRRGVVGAVSDDRDEVALGLQGLDDLDLGLGQRFGAPLGDAQPGRDSGSGVGGTAYGEQPEDGPAQDEPGHLAVGVGRRHPYRVAAGGPWAAASRVSRSQATRTEVSCHTRTAPVRG
jgi:hypothetical protein